MKKRSILIFPKLVNGESIEAIRRTYDPLWDKVPPHVTLVFPFESLLSNEAIIAHVEKESRTCSAFELELEEQPFFEETGYIYLKAAKGIQAISDLHDRLYAGIMQSYLHQTLSYVPHMTVGYCTTGEQLAEASRELGRIDSAGSIRVDRFYLEEIQEDDTSKILHEFLLDDSFTTGLL